MISSLKTALSLYGIGAFILCFPVMVFIIVDVWFETGLPLDFLESWFIAGIFYLTVGSLLVPVLTVLFQLVDRYLTY